MSTLDNDDLDLRRQLREIGRRRREAAETMRQTIEEAGPLIRAARNAGVSVSAIADDSGVSRDTVYAILRSG